MKRFLLALALFCTLSASPAPGQDVVTRDQCGVLQRPTAIGQRADGTIVIGGQTLDANPDDRTVQLVFIDPDLSSLLTQWTGPAIECRQSYNDD